MPEDSYMTNSEEEIEYNTTRRKRCLIFAQNF